MDKKFVPMSRAAAEAGISRGALGRLAASGVLPTYASPLDRRLKLVAPADLARLQVPQVREQRLIA